MTAHRLLGAIAVAVVGALALAGCVAKADAASAGALDRPSTADGCDVSAGDGRRAARSRSRSRTRATT